MILLLLFAVFLSLIESDRKGDKINREHIQ